MTLSTRHLVAFLVALLCAVLALRALRDTVRISIEIGAPRAALKPVPPQGAPVIPMNAEEILRALPKWEPVRYGAHDFLQLRSEADRLAHNQEAAGASPAAAPNLNRPRQFSQEEYRGQSEICFPRLGLGSAPVKTNPSTPLAAAYGTHRPRSCALTVPTVVPAARGSLYLPAGPVGLLGGALSVFVRAGSDTAVVAAQAAGRQQSPAPRARPHA